VLPAAGARAEGDGVVGSGAGECGGGVVVGVAVGPRARRLEVLRVHGRAARVRVPELAAAAVLGPAERLARAPACLGLSLARAQLGRAPLVEVGEASGDGASRRRGLHQHGQVVPVHQAHVVVVLAAAAVERELHQRGGRRGACAVALHLAGPAVPRRARALTGRVERAPRARPEPARPPRRRRQGTSLAGAQLESRRLQWRAPRVRKHTRPHRAAAPVRERERHAGHSLCTRTRTNRPIGKPPLNIYFLDNVEQNASRNQNWFFTIDNLGIP
jgi:hypothetical protein